MDTSGGEGYALFGIGVFSLLGFGFSGSILNTVNMGHTTLMLYLLYGVTRNGMLLFLKQSPYSRACSKKGSERKKGVRNKKKEKKARSASSSEVFQACKLQTAGDKSNNENETPVQ
ncbi:hypothetical protein G7K_6533-t1 [Saitoella complicata NRRL Y-17804]|uniref:Uncharacterized protein n=1 Tax=Saitoella complicata (strain BCRC 22490 / CBS 7301 / JCM 7358 / NBRC 10748 / NRRL Y-17804) TaxID=698492 RepID=A0A0E9NRG8_SAICN|nr:hypothetical protein G7K_6533-t1 [Saitoella complicata NRRL Y-17804]